MNRSHNFRSLVPRYAVALTILSGISACGDANRAGTVATASGTSWSEGTFVDSGDQAQVRSVEVIAVGGRGGNVAGTIGGDGCLVRTTVRTIGTPFMSQLGTEGQGVASLSANGGAGGYGLGVGGKGGTIGLASGGATGGAGGGGATAVWRDGITIAIAAGGGGASASQVGGWACANNTQDGGDGAGGDTAGKGARLVNGVRTFGAGGINSASGSGGSAGNCNFPTFSSTPQPVAVGGAGAVGFLSRSEGGGGGGAGSCGGGAGANGTSDVRNSGGGGAGLSYGWTESGSEGFAPPTYTPTSSGPIAVFNWVQIAPVGTLQSEPNRAIYRILAADFGRGPLTSSQGARWRIISGAPSGLELNASTGELRWYAPSIGSWTVTIEAAATSNGLVVAHSRIKIGLWIFIPGMPGTPSAPVL